MAIFTPSFNRDSVKVIAHKKPYQGFLNIHLYKLTHRLFSGGWSSVIEREVLVREKAVAALLFDPELDQIVFIEQFRIGPFSSGQNPWVIELVAGLSGPNETAEQVIIREIKEETGLKSFGLIPIYSYWPSPGGTGEHLTLFCAKVDASKAGGIHGLSNENEDIKVHLFELKDAYELLKTNTIYNAATIIALQWLQYNEAQVREQWDK